MGFVGGTGGHSAYHASKSAVRIYSKAAVVRYGPLGVRVNMVHPGYMLDVTHAGEHNAKIYRPSSVRNRRLPWGSVERPSTRPLRGLLRMRSCFNAINGLMLRSAQRVRLEARAASLQPIS
jgi:NAD(P)-dependent dehydrogenase (short-subunit alcohol dehydrogenase family)